MFKKLIQYHLRFLARRVLKKYQPLVVGITGNVGKTSTKEAIYTVTRGHFDARRNQKNYNNELGAPLAILDQEVAGRSPIGWAKVFLNGWGQILFRKEFPEILILEMGVDRPGDMRYLTSFIHCFAGVVTPIGEIPAHIEFFNTVEDLAKEKSELVKSLPVDGWAILNYDDSLARNMRQLTRAKTIFYGFDERANLFASDISLLRDKNEVRGMAFKINYQGKSIPVRLPHILSREQIPNILAAIACGLALELNLLEIVESLRSLKPLAGRMRLISGIKNSLILDDSYNAAPKAMLAALDVLVLFDGRRRVAVLGDMLELGGQSEKAHRQVGLKVAEAVDILIIVGLRAKFIAQTAQKQGLAPSRIYQYDDIGSAMAQIEEIIKPGDAILVKASQGMRFEKIVKDIMAEPLRAKELLVRQDNNWLRS